MEHAKRIAWVSNGQPPCTSMEEDTARRYELQVRWYQRDRLACRLKLYSTAQLVSSLLQNELDRTART